MAKKKATEEEIVITESEDNKPSLSPEETRKLFEAADKIGDQLRALDEQRETLTRERSALVEQIYRAHGNGPFEWRGRIITVTKRDNTYYMRGQSDVKSIKVG